MYTLIQRYHPKRESELYLFFYLIFLQWLWLIDGTFKIIQGKWIIILAVCLLSDKEMNGLY